MHSTGHIQYLSQQEIDKSKWNGCVANSFNGLMYGLTHYLNAMANQWSGLVLNNYEAVMPLTWKRKFGINYLYQPPFIQQLGIFGNAVKNEELVSAFMQEAKNRFSFCEIHLNNGHPPVAAGLQVRSNYVLNLQTDYSNIESGFTGDLKKNLIRTRRFQLRYAASNNIDESMALYLNNYASRTTHVTSKHYTRFTALCKLLQQNGNLLIRNVYHANSQLLATGIFLYDGRRLYNMANTTLPEGRQLEANHFLLAQLIEEFSNQPLLLDFEGSDIEGIAFFYQKFGAVNQPYYFWRFNQLPFWLKWMKGG